MKFICEDDGEEKTIEEQVSVHSNHEEGDLPAATAAAVHENITEAAAEIKKDADEPVETPPAPVDVAPVAPVAAAPVAPAAAAPVAAVAASAVPESQEEGPATTITEETPAEAAAGALNTMKPDDDPTIKTDENKDAVEPEASLEEAVPLEDAMILD